MSIDTIKTSLGEISVTKSPDIKDYPGYYVTLKNKEGKFLAGVLFEVDETDETPECKVHVWDTTSDEPICDFRGCEMNDELKLDFG